MELQDQPTRWLFAAGYSEKYNSLPPSQQREAMKRLTTRRRNPLTPEQCREPNPDVEAVLEAVYNAYSNKKLRSKAGSATRRATALSNAAAASVEIKPDTGEEVQLEPEGEVQIVCAEDANEAVDAFVQPALDAVHAAPPEVVQPPPEVVHSVKRVQPVQPRSKAIPIPIPVAAVPKKSLPAASGLANMLRGRAR